MRQKKICLLGAFAVGKTSLVQQFVSGIFSDNYQTTIGVTIEKKVVQVKQDAVSMVIWDIYGEDDFQKIRLSYLRGAAGYMLVADGTRRCTLKTLMDLHRLAEETLGSIPFVVVLNKWDLSQEWEITDEDLEDLSNRGWTIVKGSAKTGEGVEEAFSHLAEALIKSP